MSDQGTKSGVDGQEAHTVSIWALVAILLVGSFLLWAALRPMSSMLTFDEAYDGADALSLLHSPRLTPFFSGNNGRESAWMYFLLPFVGSFGATPFALRFAATTAGVLTLAATYRLGREVLGSRGAVWATAALAVLYWYIHMYHLALRAVLFPLIGVLAFGTLLQAYRTNARSKWLIGGFLLGLLMYTYFSARMWIGYALLVLAWWIVRDGQRRGGAALALLLGVALCVPLLIYTYLQPAASLGRVQTVAVLTPGGVWENIRLWAGAWFGAGDRNVEFNVPGRPILDPALGILVLVGIVALPWVVRKRWQAGWVLGLAIFALLPSIFSDAAPHSLRALGMTVPLALVMGAGAWVLEQGARRVIGSPLAYALPMGLLLIAGVDTYQTEYVTWLHLPAAYVAFEGHINQATNLIKTTVPKSTPVYFSPLSLDHPDLRYRAADLAPRPVGAFDSHYCFVVPSTPAVYVSLTLYEPEFQQKLSQWADARILNQVQFVSDAHPQFTIFQATPHAEFTRPPGGAEVEYGDALGLRPLAPIPTMVHPGDGISIRLAMRALHPLDRAYTVFIHLYGHPTPEEGGRLWAQVDNEACASYTTPNWKTGETVIQDFNLTIPGDLPPGPYEIAAGVYDSLTVTRLPVSAPADGPRDYRVLQPVQVREGP